MNDRFAGLGAGAGGGESKLHLKHQLVAKTKGVDEENRGVKEDAAGGENVSLKSVCVNVSLMYALCIMHLRALYASISC